MLMKLNSLLINNISKQKINPEGTQKNGSTKHSY